METSVVRDFAFRIPHKEFDLLRATSFKYLLHEKAFAWGETHNLYGGPVAYIFPRTSQALKALSLAMSVISEQCAGNVQREFREWKLGGIGYIKEAKAATRAKKALDKAAKAVNKSVNAVKKSVKADKHTCPSCEFWRTSCEFWRRTHPNLCSGGLAIPMLSDGADNGDDSSESETYRCAWVPSARCQSAQRQHS